MISVGAIRFEDWFCTSKKGRIGGGGWVHPELLCTWQLPWLAVEKPDHCKLANVWVWQRSLILRDLTEERLAEVSSASS